MKSKTRFAFVVALLWPIAASADDDDGGKKLELMAGAGIDSAAGGQGAYGRGYYALSPRLLINFSTFYILDEGRIGGLDTAKEVWLDANLEIRKGVGILMPDGQGFYRAWRAGTFLQSDVIGRGDGLLKSETKSNILALYGGFGAGMVGGSFAVRASFDLIAAAIVTEGDYFDDTLGGPVMFEGDGPSRLGGRFEMKLNMGKPNYGFAFDVQLGYRPGLDSKGLAVAMIGLYFAI